MSLFVKRRPGPRTVADDVLADLARHPGWDILKERALAHQKEEMEGLAMFLLRNPDRLDERRLQHQRGFFAGQRWFLREVANNLAAYQRQHESGDPDETTE